MRLSTIRLAGFKSFVDTTTVHLPTNLTGVVGPNGCGKSNIIDAVRWVMGESSASRLRGDAMSDVIFSGSSARKPVGSAMVELVFDNSDGKVAGEFAAFNEISVKRIVSRDGGSVYHLNGTRCRRRDIADLFLGTGLGPRSYSIIEQGMISRVIDAHPEELRAHLEEAAGISKYKERRRETENRIRHTRENLERLTDVRQEVEKQLEHLKRQARAAERYQELVAEQRAADADLRASEYLNLQTGLSEADATHQRSQTRLEALVAEQRQTEAAVETQRAAQVEASEGLNAVQAQVYEANAGLGQIEQQIRHTRELAERVGRERDEVAQSLDSIDSHIRADQEQVEQIAAQLLDAEPELELRQAAIETCTEQLQQQEQALSDWQRLWEEHAQQSSAASRAAEVERTRADFLDRQTTQAQQRIEALQREQKARAEQQLDEALSTAQSAQEEEASLLEQIEEGLAGVRERSLSLQEQQRGLQSQLSEQRQAVQERRGRLASLEALQQAALGQDDGELSQKLSAIGLDPQQRIGQGLDVDEGWERAVEVVLGALIEAIPTAEPHSYLDKLSTTGERGISLMQPDHGDLQVSDDSLAARVRGPCALRQMLANVYCAEDAKAALALSSRLEAGTSVVTGEGLWLGEGWLRKPTDQGAGAGVLARERELQSLREDVDSLTANIAALEEQLATLRQDLQQSEREREDWQKRQHQTQRRVAELAGEVKALNSRIEAATARGKAIADELASLEEQLQQAGDEVRRVRGRLEEAVERMAQAETQRGELESQRRSLSDGREHSRNALRQAREAAHTLALTVESQRAAKRSLEQALQRLSSQKTQLQSRSAQLNEQAEQGEAPVQELEQQRQQLLSQRLVLENQLAQARRALEDVDAELRRLDAERQRIDRELTQQREQLSDERLAAERLRVRAQQLLEGIVDLELDMDSLIQNLDRELSIEDRHEHLNDLAAKIRRLEPVNLAAIQEHAQLAERKDYLDAQDADLNQALETLEDAMHKIDRETRTRFKETFDRVNQGLQELFPRLFGGGHAYLELTGDDLLSTGVAIMARPPGKRVTSINLLSGGEKALTAVALVFAIFRLNPAPFCLLDEVDAPLDEANVGRFSTMVKEMSERVQFVFVTHNKGTMEVAQQLAGVTMREPGVSRLVSVDLAEASRLAGAV